MRRVCFIENCHYKKREIKDVLSMCDKDLNDLIKELLNRKVMQLTEIGYSFTYVGLILYKKLVIFIAPKYIKKEFNINQQNELIKLFKEYSMRESLDIKEYEYLGYSYGVNCNLISLVNYILDDYINNGLYINDERIKEINGCGNIDWNGTIEKNNVFWTSNKSPIYYEAITSKINLNENLIITNIHKYIINKCIKILNSIGMIDILGYEDFYLDYNKNLLYDNKYILSCLYKELDNQFNDRKINIAKSMISFIEEFGLEGKDLMLEFYGTRYFHIVWEKVASYVFNNQYDKYKKRIPKPSWVKNGFFYKNKKETLIPDILTYYEEIDVFFILDAKYYACEFDDNGKIIGPTPGIGDIVKQLAYESVFANKFKNIKNIFIMPSINETSISGAVELPLFNTNGSIEIMNLNAERTYSMYINYKKYNKDFWIRNIDYSYKLNEAKEEMYVAEKV